MSLFQQPTTEMQIMFHRLVDLLFAAGIQWNARVGGVEQNGLRGAIICPGVYWHPVTGLTVVQSEASGLIWTLMKEQFSAATFVELEGHPK